jgi:N-acyl-D-aspartate/D-glutamate deacylase
MAFYSLPAWHELIQAEPDRKRMLLANPAWRDRARLGWDGASRSMIRHKELDKILFTSVARPELTSWLGRTLADLVDDRGGHPSDVLADWVALNDLVPGVVGLGVSNADPAGVAELLNHPATVISASDAGAHVQMMCAAGDTTLLLTATYAIAAIWPWKMRSRS